MRLWQEDFSGCSNVVGDTLTEDIGGAVGGAQRVCSEINTWSETYFRQDLFPSYLFSRRQFHAIVIFRLESISDLDSGSLPRFFGEFIYIKLKIVVS